MRPKAAVTVVIAAAAAGLALAGGGSGATAYERFPEYESVEEVPLVGSLDSRAPRLGPPPRSAVRLAAHYLRISREASNVRCHGAPGDLIACRAHLTGSGATITARLALTPTRRFRALIAGCQTTRLLSGRLSEAPCFDFTYAFNKWQSGPPQIATVHSLDQTARPRTVIACFHEEISRFTAESQPSRCAIWGYRGKQFIGIPIEGMRWGHWGSIVTRGAYGVDRLNGKGVRIIAYRQITCDEGRTWYSKVNVVFPGDGRYFGLRLPACDGPSIVG